MLCYILGSNFSDKANYIVLFLYSKYFNNVKHNSFESFIAFIFIGSFQKYSEFYISS